MFFFLYVGIGERQVVMMFMRRRQIGGRAEVGLDVCGSGYGDLIMGFERCDDDIYHVSLKYDNSTYCTDSPFLNNIV